MIRISTIPSLGKLYEVVMLTIMFDLFYHIQTNLDDSVKFARRTPKYNISNVVASNVIPDLLERNSSPSQPAR